MSSKGFACLHTTCTEILLSDGSRIIHAQAVANHLLVDVGLWVVHVGFMCILSSCTCMSYAQGLCWKWPGGADLLVTSCFCIYLSMALCFFFLSAHWMFSNGQTSHVSVRSTLFFSLYSLDTDMWRGFLRYVIVVTSCYVIRFRRQAGIPGPLER